MNASLLKQPSAFLPLAMSAAALIMTALALTAYGLPDPAAPPHDEGTLARTWQLLMGLQVPVVLYFAATWLPRDPKHAGLVLALQLAAGVIAAFPVFYLAL